jgi:O-antigen/teichoic acid export membrane protein
MRRHKEILWINGAALVMNIVLTLVLASAHGAVGAAIALGICEVAIAIAASTLMIKAGGLDVDRNAALRIVLASAVGVLVTILLTPVSVVAVAVVVPPVTLGAALALKAIPHEIVSLVRRRTA